LSPAAVGVGILLELELTHPTKIVEANTTANTGIRLGTSTGDIGVKLR
jgi:hypothetical protein